MFYSQFILAKKGPLGTIWIAAHLERKLRKNQVAETDIGVTVDNILFPEVPIALRLSGHLLLGVVRIYSRQVNYLFNDCSETLGKIKQAFHSAAVDLPPEATTAPFHSITLPETFDFDELELAPDSESSFLHLNGNYVDHHVTTREQITLQDCIENNPYLGSSQFGLDERFGDGSYSLLGLDFDEEFLADKAHSSSGAGTSTPLLKEETIVPPVGCEKEVTDMDIDHHCEPLESEPHKVNANGGVVSNVIELGQIERDDQLNTTAPTILLDPLNEHAGLKAPLRNDSDFAVSKPDTPGFHAYTPRVLEACTPDLNQEYCPPDEPSTPALVDETSIPLYNECAVESAGRFSPVMLGNPERSSPFEPLHGSLLPHQVSLITPGAFSGQAIRSPSPASFQGFPLQQEQSPSHAPAAFQGFPLQQAAPAEVNREVCVIQDGNGRVSFVKGNAAAVSTSFESFPQPISLQQVRTAASHDGTVFPAGTSNSLLTSPEASFTSLHQQIGNSSVTLNYPWAATARLEVSPGFQQHGLAVNPHKSHEGTNFSAGASNSLLTSPEASLASSHQQIGNSSVTVNYSWAGTVPQEVCSGFQQKGLAVSPSNSESTFGFMVGSSTLQPLRSMQNSVSNPVLTSSFMSSASVVPSFSASSGSILPTENALLLQHTENMNLDKEAGHEIHDLAARKGLLWRSAAQQHAAAMPAMSAPIGTGERETLRSAASDLQRGTPDFLLLQKRMSDERIPGLELDRNNFFGTGTDGVAKEAVLPELDKTPTLREETPSFMVTTGSFFSTHSVNSLPGDDDVLASILGRRTKAFKVVSTPRVPKLPKASVVAKRPRKTPRVTPKKRKIDIDTVAVLHGDVIRQQLANSEDIRRERRKAPCTRREVWGFMRENEGQEKFDEPTLSELSPDLHDLYHDVLYGPESRPPSSALSGAAKANQALESELVRIVESDCQADCVNRDANNLDTRGENFPLVNKDFSKDVCSNELVGSCEQAEQLKKDMKVETAQENVERLTVEKALKPEVYSAELAGKERDTNSFPESQLSEDHIASSILPRETGANEQAVQHTELDREIEGTGHSPGDIMVNSLAENIVGVVGVDVGNQGIAMALQQSIESLEEKHLSSGLDKGEVSVLSNDATLEAVDVPLDGNGAAEVTVSNVLDMDTGNVDEGKYVTEVPVSKATDIDTVNAKDRDISPTNMSEAGTNLCRNADEGKDVTDVPVSKTADIDTGNAGHSDIAPTSNLAEAGTTLCKDDEEMAVMELEGDTDFLDEDNDVAYAEIDYSSDEQDVAVQESGGWSARSRNVGRYLKSVFEEMEGSSKRFEQGSVLGLERLLARKTKREAARMFFETLVLKSKDYIHVEQKVAYQDIHLYPRSKLMKTEF